MPHWYNLFVELLSASCECRQNCDFRALPSCDTKSHDTRSSKTCEICFKFLCRLRMKISSTSVIYNGQQRHPMYCASKYDKNLLTLNKSYLPVQSSAKEERVWF